MPSSRSAPNRRCAVPGTPIMPAPSTFTIAMFSMLVMPLTGSLELGFAQISEPCFSGAKVLRIQMGMPRPTAGAMVCGWITLAPKYASSMASLYDSESMTLASGTRRGSADSTPSTSVQMWISLASSKRAEDRTREVAAVAPESRLHAAAVRGDEAGDDERALEIRARPARAAWRAIRPTGRRDRAGPTPRPRPGAHRSTSPRRRGSCACAKNSRNSLVDQISP